MTTDTIMTLNPIWKKDVKVSGYPLLSAIPATTMLALAPMSDPLPPRHAPKQRAQAKGLMSRPRSSFEASWTMMGTMVAVYL